MTKLKSPDRKKRHNERSQNGRNLIRHPWLDVPKWCQYNICTLYFFCSACEFYALCHMDFMVLMTTYVELSSQFGCTYQWWRAEHLIVHFIIFNKKVNLLIQNQHFCSCHKVFTKNKGKIKNAEIQLPTTKRGRQKAHADKQGGTFWKRMCKRNTLSFQDRTQ